jgi:hypothetical protein
MVCNLSEEHSGPLLRRTQGTAMLIQVTMLSEDGKGELTVIVAAFIQSQLENVQEGFHFLLDVPKLIDSAFN